MAIQSFANLETEALFTTGKSRRFGNIARVAERKLAQLDAAPSVNFMKAPPGNDLKEYDGAWHVRIIEQWRLTFKWGPSGPYDVLIEDPHRNVRVQKINLNSHGAIMFKNGMRPVHPGEILLEDYIKPMGVSVRAVAIALHVPYSRLSEITKGERGVTADTALRLERYFGSEAQGWLNLQSAYELRVAETSVGKTIAKEIKPLALEA